MRNTRRHIYLIGFSGCGKSTVGPLLARRLGVRFADTDAIIESRTGKSISALFANDGQMAFRRIEMETLASVADRAKAHVVALGGGAILRAPNRAVMKRTGAAVYLRCSLRELYRRLSTHTDRPLLITHGESRRQVMGNLLQERRPVYASLAYITVSTSNQRPEEVVSEIIRRLGRK